MFESFFVLSTALTAAYAIPMLPVNSSITDKFADFLSLALCHERFERLESLVIPGFR
jgi:hypothetical protein